MPLSVSTKCPSCGGALEFEEGTTAVRCPYCGTSHVVTGHGRTLSYYIHDKIPADIAVARALMKLKEEGDAGCRVKDATLFFVPFYRFTGQALCWEAVKQPASNEEQKGIFGFNISIDIIDVNKGGPAIVGTGVKPLDYELNGRNVDRSMPAVEAPGLGMASLGIKASVLKLALFDKDAVSKRGHITPVTALIAEKEKLGYTLPDEGNMAAKAVYGKSVSIVYYPLWAVEMAGAGGDGPFLTVVDGVGGDVVSVKSPITLLDSLLGKDDQVFGVAGLRPLKCPDCDSDLPVKPKDLVFFCPNCRKAWYISGEDLIEIPYRTAPARIKKDCSPEHFPFWTVRARAVSDTLVVENKYDLSKLAPGAAIIKEADKEIPLRFFIPAFRLGNMKSLEKLAAAFTRNQPVLPGEQERISGQRGCAISPEDALNLAPFIIFSIIPKGNHKALAFAQDAKVEVDKAELVLFPFFPGRMEYTDGLYGMALPTGAIRE